jgi:hypothetical protein
VSVLGVNREEGHIPEEGGQEAGCGEDELL